MRVTLVDHHNYHQFQPLLYQVATSQLAPSDIAFQMRKLFRDHPNVDVKLADVAAVDPAARTVTMTEGEPLTGDALVVATGSRPELLPNAGRRGARLPALHATTTPPACGRASSACSRTPTATPRCSTGAR